MAVCGLCGHRLACRQKDSSSRRTYECRGREKEIHLDESERCSLGKIEADWLEREVWANFRTTVSNSGVLRQSINDAVAKLEDRKREMEAASQPIDRQLERVERRINRLVRVVGLAEDDLTGSDLAGFEEELAKLRKEKANLEDRKKNLNPEVQTEVSRLEDYIASVRQLLDRGGLVAEPDGIWAYAFNQDGGLEDAECFGSRMDVEEILDRVTRAPEPQEAPVVGDDGMVHCEMTVDLWAFEHPVEACIRSMRNVLQKFDTKVLAFPDRVEVHGLIPTKVIAVPAEATRQKRGREFNSAY